MKNTCYLRYLGTDRDLQSQLAPLLASRRVEWKSFADVDDLLDDCQRSTLGHEEKDGRDDGNSLEEAYAPVILDFPLASEAALILRELKAISRGIPVIILSEQSSLSSFSLALLDGSEAFLLKPLDTMTPLFEAIDRANRRVQHWVEATESAQVASFS